MLLPGLTWPPFPSATIVSISVFGFQVEKAQAVPETLAQSDPVARNVPERYRVPCPLYVLRAEFESLALPSMNIVPLTASVFVVAFQESSPLGVASSQMTVWLTACVAAAVPFAPRVTVHVVVPKPEVTVITSSSILRLNCEVGKPVTDATVTVF